MACPPTNGRVPNLQLQDSEKEPRDNRRCRECDHYRQDGSKDPGCPGIRNANEVENLGKDENWPPGYGARRVRPTVTSVLAGTTVALGGM